MEAAEVLEPVEAVATVPVSNYTVSFGLNITMWNILKTPKANLTQRTETG